MWRTSGEPAAAGAAPALAASALAIVLGVAFTCATLLLGTQLERSYGDRVAAGSATPPWWWTRAAAAESPPPPSTGSPASPV
ncbi:MAG: hypothetical protein R2719_11645 [Micropruina sp.]